jgi:hypothetical protein
MPKKVKKFAPQSAKKATQAIPINAKKLELKRRLKAAQSGLHQVSLLYDSLLKVNTLC